MVDRHVPPVLFQSELNELIDDVNDLKNGGITLEGVRSYPCSYVIRKNGVYYEAIDSAHNLDYGGEGDAGGVDGENMAAVINACIGNGRNIFVASPGTHTLTAPLSFSSKEGCMLILESGTKLHFDGAASPFIGFNSSSQCGVVCVGRADIVNVDGAGSKTLIRILDSNYIALRGLYLDGNDGADSVGIEFNASDGVGTYFCDVRNVRIIECVTGVNMVYAGTGWHNRNRFYNLYCYDCSTVGVVVDGNTCSGNTFVACEFAHCGKGVIYNSATTPGGNVFLGCTWDTNDINAVYITDADHRGLQIIGGTIWHTAGAGATDAFAFGAESWKWGDCVRGVSGEAHSDLIGSDTITAGLTTRNVAINMFRVPSHITLTPTTWTGDMTLVITAKSATQFTVGISGVYGANINFTWEATLVT